jgi:DinB superfamily
MRTRPVAGDAHPYFFTYIDKAEGEDCVSIMTTQLDTSLALLASISEEKSLHRYAPGKWSIREVLSHITDTERVFSYRALWFARGLDTPLPSFDQDTAVRGAEADRLPWAVHVEEFANVRKATIDLFRNLPGAAWTRGGIASENPLTVLAIGFIIPGHLEHHFRLLQERYL